MDGSLFFRGKDPEQEPEVYKASQRTWNERLKEKDKQIKYARWTSVAAFALLAGSMAGNVYLGTMPKSSVDYVAVDYATYRPLVRFNTKNMKSINPMVFRHARLVDFVVNLHSVRQDAAGQRDAMRVAFEMTAPDTPARIKGKADTEGVYDRAKHELVYVKDVTLNPSSGGEVWHVTFREEVVDLRGQSLRDEHFTGIIETKTVNSDKFPGGFVVFDYGFNRSAGK